MRRRTEQGRGTADSGQGENVTYIILCRYMVHHRVPDSLQKRVKKWFDYSWGRTHGVDESSLLETLPDKLRARIQIQIHLKTLKKVCFRTVTAGERGGNM